MITLQFVFEKMAIVLIGTFFFILNPSCFCCGLDIQIKGEVTRMAISEQELQELQELPRDERSISDNSPSPSRLVQQKLLLLLGMLLTTLVSGLLPRRLYAAMGVGGRKSTWEAIISFSSCFSGGVFMAAAFLDLIPETNVKIKEVLELIRLEFDVEIHFPVTEFTILVGFLLVLAIEQSVLHWQETWTVPGDCNLERGSPLLERGSPLLDSNNYESVPSQEPIITSETLETICSNSTSSKVSHVHHDDTGGDDHGDHSHVTPAMFQQSVLRSFLLLLALTFHSVFEGIAIGLQEAPSGLLSLFIAVIVHKCIMSFSLGLNLAQARLSLKSYILSILIFAAASPVGVGIGIGVVGLPESLAQDIVSGILQALAAGTFLYITFFEVLPHELNLPGRRISKVGFVILGFVIMCILLVVAPHDHGGAQHQHANHNQHQHANHLNKSFLSDPPPYFESHRMKNFEPNTGHGHNAHDHGQNEHDHDHNSHNHGYDEHDQGHDGHGHHFYAHDNHADMHNVHQQTDTHNSHENAKNEYDIHEHNNERHDDSSHDDHGQDHHDHSVHDEHGHEHDHHDHSVHDDHGHEHDHHAGEHRNATL